MTGLLYMPEVWAMPAGKALGILRDEVRWEVDRRLRAVGLYPLRPEACAHHNGLEREPLRLVFRCRHCGLYVTDEVLAAYQALQKRPTPAEDMLHVGRMIGSGLWTGLRGASAESRAAVARRVAEIGRAS